MPKYAVIYFQLKGVGESIRMLLSYAGQEFEDRRILKNDWPEYKPKTPFGQLPLLEIDGKLYAQSVPILRYLGKKFGLAGDNIEQDFEIDQNAHLITDIMAKVSEYFQATVEKKKNIVEEVIPALLKQLDQVVEKNKGHIALGKLTWGDFLVAGFCNMLSHVEITDWAPKYPALKRNQDMVFNLPGVKKFLENAPPDAYHN